MVSPNHRTKWLTIRHYLRMRKYVRKHLSGYISAYQMRESIGESWGDADCPYCQKKKFSGYCDLGYRGVECSFDNCCNKLWRKLSQAYYWSEWMEVSTVVIDYIIKYG